MSFGFSEMLTVPSGMSAPEMERLWNSGARDRYSKFGIGIAAPPPSFGVGYIAGPPVIVETNVPALVTTSGVAIVYEPDMFCSKCGRTTPHTKQFDGTFKCKVFHSSSEWSHSGKAVCPCGDSCVNTEASHMSKCSHPRGDWKRVHYCFKCDLKTIHNFSDGGWKCSSH